MNRFSVLSVEERAEVFQATSADMGLRPDIIEKDFWVCFMLNHLFHGCRYKGSFVFKGGTSLSKSYHAIKRFSEDIDIILDWRKFVSDGDNPWDERSKTQQDIFNKQINKNAAEFYREELAPCLNREIEEMLGKGDWVSIDKEDEMVINFYYPQIFEADYIRDKVRLEIGPLAEWLPSHVTTVKPFVAEKYPNLFEKEATEVLTIDIERTFWEKLTILNRLAHYPDSKVLPPRYARHLYDVFCMANSSVKEAAFARKELLEKDVVFKQKFYYAKGAHYESANLKQISLIPAEHIMDAVKTDYSAMRNMIYGEYPEFEEVITCLKQLQEEIHELGKHDASLIEPIENLEKEEMKTFHSIDELMEDLNN